MNRRIYVFTLIILCISVIPIRANIQEDREIFDLYYYDRTVPANTIYEWNMLNHMDPSYLLYQDTYANIYMSVQSSSQYLAIKISNESYLSVTRIWGYISWTKADNNYSVNLDIRQNNTDIEIEYYSSIPIIISLNNRYDTKINIIINGFIERVYYTGGAKHLDPELKYNEIVVIGIAGICLLIIIFVIFQIWQRRK